MDQLLPNFAIMRNPFNWVLVAFVMCLMAYAFYFIKKGQSDNG